MVIENPIRQPDAPNLQDPVQVLRAMRRAVAQALPDHKEKGQYVVEWVDGRIVRIQPEDIVVPDVD